jgi:hypothetical protein
MSGGSYLEEIDEAFNWLVLILTTLGGSLISYPSLYPTFANRLNPEIPVMRVILFPLIALIILWLGSHLIRNKGTKVVLKCSSWLYALSVFTVDLLFLIGGILGVHILQYGLLWIGLASVIPISIYLKFIRREYESIYPDSQFLKNKYKQALFCVLVIVPSVGFVPILAIP